MDISENIRRIRSEIDSVNPSAEIVAATKTRDISEIEECMATGLAAAAGENRVQEFTAKYTDAFAWDFIGRLQTNKVKYIIGKTRLIQSLDRLDLALTIEKECVKRNTTQRALVEINTGGEESKGGIELGELDKFREELTACPHIICAGLMAVAPASLKEDELKRLFDGVYDIFAKNKNDTFRYLSMGMSNDYMTAVRSGANIVRPGRKIFGERIYPNA
jgi:pyridoxal phosphate enzyme (YggS family)